MKTKGFSIEANSYPVETMKWIYSQIEERIEERNKSVSLVATTTFAKGLQGFGSGFFYERDGWPFFITAYHVLEDSIEYIRKNTGAFLITRGRKEFISLSKLEFFFDRDLDIAVAPLWKMPKEGYAHIKFFKYEDVAILDQNSRLRPFAFTGFPASRNKAHTGQEMKPCQRNITMLISNAWPTDDPISPFIYFDFDRKNMWGSDLSKISMPYPEGMSGGPLFEFTGQIDQLVPKLAGVGISCLPQTNHLKVLRFDFIDAWLSSYFQW